MISEHKKKKSNRGNSPGEFFFEYFIEHPWYVIFIGGDIMTNSFVIESYSNNPKQMKTVTKTVNDLRNTISQFFSSTESVISDSSVGRFIKK